MSNVRRVYVEKKPAFAVKAKELKHEIKHYLGISTVTAVRELIRYDVENISDEVFEKACKTVFAEPPVDDLYLEKFDVAEGARVFSVEFLPGQFDQRADSAVQCVQFLDENAAPIIRSATTYVIEGTVTDAEFEAIKHHCINPVDSRETGLEKPETLVTVFPDPEDVKIFDGFKDMAEADLKELYASLNLAMTFKDTTFSTELTSVKFDEGDYKAPIEKTYEEYLDAHKNMYKGRDDKFVCLMDLALMAMKKLKAEGKLADQEESDEINACSIVVPVDVDGKEEEWLINFKNETHNHPTEIEPFGGAATCLGGAIRDPLSGRTYVYQAMRVTGAADPTVSVRIPIREISSSFLEDVPAVTVSVVLPVLPRFTQRLPLRSAAQRCRKVMHRQSVRSRECSAEKKSAISSRNVMTSVRAVFLLPSASWHQDFRSTLTKFRRSMPASTEPRSPSPSPRSVWLLWLTRKMWILS